MPVQSRPLRHSPVHSFNSNVDRTNLSTLKWEMEIARTGDGDLLSFGTADIDFRSPPAVVEALHRAVEAGHFGYPLRRKSYFDAAIGYLDRHFGWRVEQDWIESGVGVYPSMHPIIMELTQPGDEIIYQPPAHHVFREIIDANDRVAVANPLVQDDGVYRMDFAGLASAITDRTKMLLLCSPHNPVGRVWTREELNQLARICSERNIIVVCDEVYCGLLYEGATFTPFATVSEWASMNSYSLISPSKPFNLTGLKHSLTIARNADLRAAYRRGLNRTSLAYGGSVLGYAAAEAAFANCDDWSRDFMAHIARNHAYLADLFGSFLPEVKISQADATYFAWLNLTGLGADIETYRPMIEKEARLVVTYGEPMGAGGERHVRVNLGTSRSNLQQGMHRLLSALVPLTGREFNLTAIS